VILCERSTTSSSATPSNIETKLVTLSQRERQLRQEEITTEIVELATGAEESRRAVIELIS
jgi:F0F1-type ATP synthase gamma subunit